MAFSAWCLWAVSHEPKSYDLDQARSATSTQNGHSSKMILICILSKVDSNVSRVVYKYTKIQDDLFVLAVHGDYSATM